MGRNNAQVLRIGLVSGHYRKICCATNLLCYKSAVLQIEDEGWKAGFLIRNGCEWDGYYWVNYWVNYDDRPGSQLCAELDHRVSVLLCRH